MPSKRAAAHSVDPGPLGACSGANMRSNRYSQAEIGVERRHLARCPNLCFYPSQAQALLVVYTVIHRLSTVHPEHP